MAEQSEIVSLANGPLGAWSAVGSDDVDVGTCSPNSEPAEPALCECAPASCDAP